jgi:hypothetical protein
MNSTRALFGDLTLQAQYRLTQFHEGHWMPTASFALQETMPTGKYDQLGNRPGNGIGNGVWTTTPALYSQSYFWLPNGRILRARLNVTQSFSNSARIWNVSVYGTQPGFEGRAQPGSAFFVDAAGEYSLTRNWVLALDATYHTQGKTTVSGTNHSNPIKALVNFNVPSNSAVAFAPAIEYNWKANIGVILGVRIVAAGRNTNYTLTPAIAINFVH